MGYLTDINEFRVLFAKQTGKETLLQPQPPCTRCTALQIQDVLWSLKTVARQVGPEGGDEKE